MPVLAEQTDSNEGLVWAAAQISRAIDEITAALPPDADLTEMAFNLISEIEAMCDRGDIIAIFKEALIARQALSELEINLDPS
jgi:hypothetical protein